MGKGEIPPFIRRTLIIAGIEPDDVMRGSLTFGLNEETKLTVQMIPKTDYVNVTLVRGDGDNYHTVMYWSVEGDDDKSVRKFDTKEDAIEFRNTALPDKRVRGYNQAGKIVWEEHGPETD